MFSKSFWEAGKSILIDYSLYSFIRFVYRNKEVFLFILDLKCSKIPIHPSADPWKQTTAKTRKTRKKEKEERIRLNGRGRSKWIWLNLPQNQLSNHSFIWTPPNWAIWPSNASFALWGTWETFPCRLTFPKLNAFTQFSWWVSSFFFFSFLSFFSFRMCIVLNNSYE